MTVLVTGGAGYIGSHIAHMLLDQGERVAIFDNLVTGNAESVPAGADFYQIDIGDTVETRPRLRALGVTSVIHCAGSTVVPESVLDPLKYYENNVAKPLSLLKETIAAGVKSWIFSSTAAVYGIPEGDSVTEDCPTRPVSPYGRSKLQFEHILSDTAQAHGIGLAILRYFNVAGADPQGRSGQSTPDATHLIKVCVEAALGKRPSVDLYGADYDTPDGTCIRDYIHVADLADIHVRILKETQARPGCLTLNCGYSKGYSVREVMSEVSRISGANLNVVQRDRRPGDMPSMIADTTRLRDTLNWEPRYDQLSRIVEDALRWERKLKAH